MLEALESYGIPTKLIRIFQISSSGRVLVGGKESKKFGVARDMKQDEAQ